jgi:hypothetical protein
MRPLRTLFFFVVLVSVAALSCTEDNEPGQSCSDPSVCGPTATIQVDLPTKLQDLGQLMRAHIELCRNDDFCVRGSFDSLNALPSPNTGVPIVAASTPDGGTTSGVTVLVMATMNNDYWLRMFWPNALGGTPADGDVYSVTLVDGDGMTAFSKHFDPATYDVARPFGNDCPTVCRHVDFNLHTS